MAKLTDTEKHEIVILLARFTSYSDVAVIMSREHGIEIDRLQARTYDPENPRYAAGERWRQIFEAARTKYLEDIADIPIASQAFRLNQLNELFFKAKQQGNIALAMKLLDQAAAESGRIKPVESPTSYDRHYSELRNLTPEERRARVSEMLRDAMDRAASKKPEISEHTQNLREAA